MKYVVSSAYAEGEGVGDAKVRHVLAPEGLEVFCCTNNATAKGHE